MKHFNLVSYEQPQPQKLKLFVSEWPFLLNPKLLPFWRFEIWNYNSHICLSSNSYRSLRHLIASWSVHRYDLWSSPDGVDSRSWSPSPIRFCLKFPLQPKRWTQHWPLIYFIELKNLQDEGIFNQVMVLQKQRQHLALHLTVQWALQGNRAHQDDWSVFEWSEMNVARYQKFKAHNINKTDAFEFQKQQLL